MPAEAPPKLSHQFSFEDRGRIYTDADLAAERGVSWEWKEREAKRLHDLWDGFAPGMQIVADDSERGFHWASD